jgi:hypothetical protein
VTTGIAEKHEIVAQVSRERRVDVWHQGRVVGWLDVYWLCI